MICRRRVCSCSTDQTLKIDWSTIVKKWNSSRGSPSLIVRSDTWKRRLRYYIWRRFWDTPSERTHRTTTINANVDRLWFLRLVCVLLQWKLENVSLFLEIEVNVSKQDREGYTPLVKQPLLRWHTALTADNKNRWFSQMWACKRGHKDTAILLCQWYQTVQNSNNDINQQYCQPDILESVHQCT